MAPAFEFVITAGQGTGAPYPFPSAHFVLGSAPSAELRFPSNLVRPRHVELELDPMGVVWVRDLTGEQLMAIDGEVLERGALEPGSRLRLGPLELELGVLGAPRHAVGQTTGGVAPAPNPAVTATNLTGMVVDGRYEVISKLASGGMGDVYRARHVELGKLMVLKVMRPHLSDDPDIVARFKREAVSASRIGHQNIVDISDFGRTPDGRFYFVMEYLDGVTLKHLLARSGAQPLDRVLHLTVQVARALVAAHAQQIVHRDLKPENLMVLQRPGQVDFIKVLDFGVAKIAPSAGDARQTALGMVLGTPQYMSPEQARAVPIDARSDIYALGLIAYELLAGRPTFTAETPALLMFQQLTQAPPPFDRALVATLPPVVEKVICRMLEKDPAARPQTMAEVVSALERVQARRANQEFAVERLAAGVTQPAAAIPAAVTQPVAPIAPTLRAQSQPTTTLARPPKAAAPSVDPEPLPALSRSRAPLVVVGVVVTLGLVGLMAALWPAAPPAPAPVEPPPAVPDAALALTAVEVARPAQPSISITFTTPVRADVFEGDVQLGSTPLALTRELNAVASLTFTAPGYKALTRRVAFVVAQTLAIELEKDKPKPVPAVPRPRPEDALKPAPY